MRLNGESKNILQENIEKLIKIFPEINCEGKINFDLLKELMGENVDNNAEKYSFTWSGKSNAIRISQTPTTSTLLPMKTKSINWEESKNIFVEGDNLEVLKILQKSYHNKIKMIYIDPPYNTGKDFIYSDSFTDSVKNYLNITGQLDEDFKNISTNSEVSGRYHTNWLNMMYPRLRLARNLLSDDGVIFISIDDNESHNLRKICDMIFGEQNYVQEIIWEKKFAPQNDAKYFSLNHEQVFCYAKNKEKFKRNLLPMTDDQIARYKNLDNDYRGPWQSDNLVVTTYSKSYDYPITKPNGSVVNPPNGRCWRVSKEKFSELLKDNRIWFGSDGNGVPRLKRFLSEVQQGRVPISIFPYKEVGHTQEASKDLKDLFDGKKVFDFSKPVRLIDRLLRLATNEDSIILDFFAGSATTAHAVMNLNNEDGGKRKYILVQLPELLDPKSETYKLGYGNICDVGIDRIKRAAENITKNVDGYKSLDCGFKYFRLDKSNIKEWNPDVDTFEITLENSVNNWVEGRTHDDVLYEIMLKYGIDLTYPVEEFDLNGSKVFSVGFGALLVCLEDNINVEIANGMVNLIQELSPEVTRVVFKDNGFKSDSVKSNVMQTLKRHNIDEVVSI